MSLTVVQAHNGMSIEFGLQAKLSLPIALGAVTTVDSSVDGKTLATGGKDKTIAIWTLSNC